MGPTYVRGTVLHQPDGYVVLPRTGGVSEPARFQSVTSQVTRSVSNGVDTPVWNRQAPGSVTRSASDGVDTPTELTGTTHCLCQPETLRGVWTLTHPAWVYQSPETGPALSDELTWKVRLAPPPLTGGVNNPTRQ